jgi:hypothetical protein
MSSSVALGRGTINSPGIVGQRGRRMGPEMGWAVWPRPISQLASWTLLPVSSRLFSLLHVGP